MKVAYDIKLMRPACVILAAGLGADREASVAFNSDYWLTFPTPNMGVYEVTEQQLEILIAKTIAANSC